MSRVQPAGGRADELRGVPAGPGHWSVSGEAIIIGTLTAVPGAALFNAAGEGLLQAPSLPGPLALAMPWAAGGVAAAVIGLVAWRLLRRRRGVHAAGDVAPAEASPEYVLVPPQQAKALLPPRPPAPYLLQPYTGAALFTGRARERQELSEWLRRKEGPPVRAVVGSEGIGKSALAWAWLIRDVLVQQVPEASADAAEVTQACRIPPRSRPQGVMWWSFDRADSSFSVFMDEALAYLSSGTIGAGNYLSARSQKIDNLVEVLRQSRHLLVLDGCERLVRGEDQLCVDQHASEFLRRLADGPTSSRVLVVTRVVPAEVEGGTKSSLELKGMETVEAVALLGRCGVHGRASELRLAAVACGCHPLTLRLAAGLCLGGTPSSQAARKLGGRGIDDLVEQSIAPLPRPSLALLCHLAAFRAPFNATEASMFESETTPASVVLDDLVARGLLMYDGAQQRYEPHGAVRRAAMKRLSDAAPIHAHLAAYYAQFRMPLGLTKVQDLQPAIERYVHLVAARRNDEAYALLDSAIAGPLRNKFADQPTLQELLERLFHGSKPRLSQPADRAAAIEAMAAACSYLGQTRRAAGLCEANIASFESADEQEHLATLLGVLAGSQSRLGKLGAAEKNLRRLVKIEAALKREQQQAVARSRLGLLLAHRGAYDEALVELDKAFELVKESINRQLQGICFSYYTQRALLMGDAFAALDAARKSRAFVEELARRGELNEHDYVRTGWLLGAAHTAKAAQGGDDVKSNLEDADRYLRDALARCRRCDLVGFEPDLLLTSARWHQLSGKTAEAKRVAGEALVVSRRCEYRLKEAEAQNFLGRLALAGRDREAAQGWAEAARDCARCDGDEFTYKAALDEAEALLADIAAANTRAEKRAGSKVKSKAA